MTAARKIPKIDAKYDPVIRRYVAQCPSCDYFAVRSKSEAAVHVLAQHVAYTHEGGGA